MAEQLQTEQLRLGKMKGSYRHPTTPSGEEFGVMKSALQKYIRRGETEKALRVAYEIDCFNYDSEKTAKGHVTNFLHRLMIIFVEDIGVTGIGLSPVLCKCWSYYFITREKRLALTAYTEAWCEYRRTELELMTIIIILMCNSVKTRSASHYKSVFIPGQNPTLIAEHPILQNIKDRSAEPVPSGVDLPIKEAPEMTKLCKHFYANLTRHDPMCVYWAFRIVDSASVGSYFKKKKSSYLVFHLLQIFVNTLPKDTKLFYTDIITCYVSWFSEISPLKEEFLYWLVPLIALIEKREPQPYDLPSADQVNSFIQRLYPQALKGSKINLDEYVFDMHTRSGQGGRVYFATESSKVFPEDQKINNLYRLIYNQNKYLQDGKSLAEYYKDQEKAQSA